MIELSYVQADRNGKNIREHSWPLLDDWKMIFGKDRANGDTAELVMDAVNELLQNHNLESAHNDKQDKFEGMADNVNNDIGEDSVCQSTKMKESSLPSKKKQKTTDKGYKHNVCELLKEIHRDTNARLESLASRIGYQADLGKARKEVFDLLEGIPGLSLNDKFFVCDFLADKVAYLEVFMGLPVSARPAYVMRIMNMCNSN